MDKSQDIIATLKEATEGMLSEDSLTAIETAFNAAVDTKTTLNVEAALIKQD